MHESPPKVLLLRLSSLGDVVLATAALEPLKAAGCSVSFLTKAQFAPLLAGHPDLAEVFSFDKSEGEAVAREKALAWAEAQGFRFVLDLQDSWRSWSWRGKLRAHSRVHVAAKPRLREWLVLLLRLGHWFGFRRGSRAQRFRRAAESALAAEGFELQVGTGPLTSLQVRPEEKERVRSLLPAGDFAVVLPASAWKSKEWPYFPELAKVIARKVPVVALGGANDSSCEQVASAARQANPESRSLHGKTNLRESMAVIANARWVLGNDTGMVHVAEALGKDVAMIEGPTHPFMGFSPYRKGSLVLGLPLACRPCSKSGKICYRFGTRHCLYGLKVAEVADKLRERGFPC